MKPVIDIENRLQDKLELLLIRHLHALIFSLGQLCRNSIASILTISVIGISLALPSGFYVVLENAQFLTSRWEGTVEITAFLKSDIDETTALKVRENLLQQNNINSVELITSEQALAEYRQLSGFSEALDELDSNPLPALLLIKPSGTNTEQSIEDILELLKSVPQIEHAQYDQQWVKRLNAIINIVERIIIILSVFLALAVMLIIGNTIRMLIYHRRVEIEIAKLFGATDGFIQLPFLYSGFWYGLFGSLVAWILIVVSLQLVQGPASNLAELYASTFELLGLDATNVVYLFTTGILLGLLGSYISVQKHLMEIEPA